VRRKGYRKALKAAGIAHDPALELAGTGYHREDGAASMRELLALPEPPDAVFCFNDLLALGALRTLADAGLSVPDDVAVVGFDDIEDGRYHSPSLTTVAPDMEWLADHAVALLLDRIAGNGEAARRDLTVPHTLMIRESTGGS
jgi:DNA-binding LacI/PurR family transcriptional regulator